MSTDEQTPLSQPTFVVRNTLGKEQVPQNLSGSISNEAPREYCDKNYHQILPIVAEKVHQEKVQHEKLKAVKARLYFEESSRHSELGTSSRRRDLKERLRPRHVRSRSESPEPRCDCSKSPKEKGPERKTMFKRLENGVFHRLGDKEKSVSVYSRDLKHRSSNSSCRNTESYYQSSRFRGTKLASEKHHGNRKLPDPGEWISILNSEIRKNLSSTTRVHLPVEDDHSPLLAYVIWILLAYLTYPVIPPYLHSFGNEDTIFDPGIAINRFDSFKPGLSHRCGTFKKFNTHRSHLNESPMEMLFSTCFLTDQ
nr:reverse transcriptase domain-containing protein [Tanacetum cinerariifolium]